MESNSNDYYLTLSHLVAGIDPNTMETRRAVYDRARRLLVEHARQAEPPWDLFETVHEQRLLEEAIHEVEVEYCLLEAAIARTPRWAVVPAPVTALRAPPPDLYQSHPRRVWIGAAAGLFVLLAAIAGIAMWVFAPLQAPAPVAPEERVNIIRQYLDRGDEAARKGDHDGAIEAYGDVIRIDPANVAAFNNRAYAHWNKGNVDQAIADYSQAIQVDPGNAVALSNRAVAYNLKGEYALAIRDLDEAIRLRPSDSFAWNSRCWSKALAGQLESALLDCNEALRLRPNEPNTLDSRGLVLLKMSQYDRAIADYDAALRIDPKLAASLYGRSLAKSKKGDRAGGEADMNAAKAIIPDIAERFARYGVR